MTISSKVTPAASADYQARLWAGKEGIPSGNSRPHKNMALSGKTGVDRSHPAVIPRRVHEMIRASYARFKAYATAEGGQE
jgi:hypothetical protein